MAITKKCNLCGKDFTLLDDHFDMSLHEYAGYGSKFDGSIVHIDFCTGCFDNLVESCVISPIEEEDVY